MLRAKSSSLRGELSLRAALVDVRVPAAELRECDLEADVGLRELRDLLQRLAERAARVLGAVLGLVPRRVGGLQRAASRRTPRGPMPFSTRSAAAAYCASNDAPTRSPRMPNCDDLVHRQRRRRALQHPRQLLA